MSRVRKHSQKSGSLFGKAGNKDYGRHVEKGDKMKIQEVFVVGSGLMGSGIAQVAAQAGMNVIINDENSEAMERAKKNISWSLKKLIEKGRINEDFESVIGRIEFSDKLERAENADIVIEAVFENIEVKQSIFHKLDAICNPKTYFASNTSTFPITELAAVTQRPEKVLGLHFFSPVPMMKAVEVVKGMNTSEEAMSVGVDLIKKMGKAPIRVETDMPGFLLNRINLVSYVEAIKLLERGIATAEDIDEGVRLAFGRPMGPFETGDMVGLDVSYNALLSIYKESREDQYYPPQFLRRKVRAGNLGRKTGKGWYSYDENGNRLK